MGNVACNMTPEERQKGKVSSDLDKKLNKLNRQVKEEVKLLLLGPGESGKSTIFKQMKIIQVKGGFTNEERKAFRFIVYSNCITQMKVLVGAAEKLGFAFDSDSNKERADRIAALQTSGEAWSLQTANDIKILWTDGGIQKTYGERDKAYQLNDSAQYFFENIDRFTDDNYLPTDSDILRARVRSTGIDEAEFEVEELEFRMLDVGGQRSERRKWIHCFDCVTAVLFCASLSEYDQTLREDDSQNRMKESLLLFDEILNSPWFRDTAFILFLNKVDLFREKIVRVPLKTCFPDYNGADEFDPASAFIKQKFIDQNCNNNREKIYPHFTCAISTENVKFVFNCVKETLLNEVLRSIIF